MGGRLKDRDMDQLEAWIGTGPKTFTLLYSITRDGCNTTTFHQNCDNQGPTVTVLYNTKDSVYGGYAGKSWCISGNWINDPTAFLYQLHHSGSKLGRKFPCKNATHSLYCQQAYGPTFGNGHDLLTFNKTIDKTVDGSGDYFALNGHLTIANAFDNMGIQVNEVNNGTMDVTELEVYSVANGTRSVVVPWRKTPTWDNKLLAKLTKDIAEYKPMSESKIPQARILMIGPVGAGKSSFFNTIDSIFKGRIAKRACCGSAEQSLTKTFTHYEVQDRIGASLKKTETYEDESVTTGTKLNFRICDTMGLEDSEGLDVIECNYLLDGNIPQSYNFNPKSPITPKTAGFISSPSLGDKIHCVAFVIDASTLEVLPDKILEKMKMLQRLMQHKGIPQSIILTKVDKICKEVLLDVSNAVKSDDVEDHAKRASQLLGLQFNSVLPVKNYEKESDVDENVSILALLALRQLLNSADDFMENLFA